MIFDDKNVKDVESSLQQNHKTPRLLRVAHDDKELELLLSSASRNADTVATISILHRYSRRMTCVVILLFSVALVCTVFRGEHNDQILSQQAVLEGENKDPIKTNVNNKSSSRSTYAPTPTPIVMENTTSRTPPQKPALPIGYYHNINDDPFVPPFWIRQYIAFHNSHVDDDGTSMVKNTRWIQWYCSHDPNMVNHCGGLADRLKGMLQSFLFAIVENRVALMEEWQDPPHPLTNYLEPNLIHWTAQPDLTDTKVQVEGYKVRDPNLFDAIHNHPCSFGLQNYTGVRYTGNYMARQNRIRAEPCLKYLWRNKAPDKHIEVTLFWTLFRFSSQVRILADRLRQPKISTRNYYLAAHVRTGNGATFHDTLIHDSKHDWDKFAKCIQVFQDVMQEQCGHRPVAYVASDSQEAKDYVAAQLPAERVQVPPGIEVIHIDKTKHSSSIKAGHETVMAEFKVLMDSTCLIMSKSGFSDLARRLSRQQQRCAIMYDQCLDVEYVRTLVQRVKCQG